MEIKNKNSSNLKLYVFFFHLASIFFQENPQLLFSPLVLQLCIHPESERSMRFWMTYTGVQTTLTGFTAPKRWIQIFVFHVKWFVSPERPYQGQKVFQPDLWLGFSCKIVNKCLRRTAYEGLYHQYLTVSTFLTLRIAYPRSSGLVLPLEVWI